MGGGGGGRAGGWRECSHVMHGRSRMTIDPCIPAMPGRTTSDFHGPGREEGGGGAAVILRFDNILPQ